MTAESHVAGEQLVVFLLEEQRYAVALDRVERVTPRPEIAPFPRAPEIVAGLVVIHGDMIPVINVRARFRLAARAARLSDQLLVVRTRRRRVALVVDRVDGVVAVATRAIVASESLTPGLEYVKGITRLEGDLVFVHDLDAFLSLEEEAKIDAAWEARAR